MDFLRYILNVLNSLIHFDVYKVSHICDTGQSRAKNYQILFRIDGKPK